MNNKTLLLVGLCACYSATTSAASLTSTQLKQQLSSTAVSKVAQGKINLDALVSNDSNDLLIEYDMNVVAIRLRKAKLYC